ASFGAAIIVALKVEDIDPNGYAIDRATVRQKKTGRPVKFELTDQTRQAVDDYLKTAGKRSGDFLFIGRRGDGRCITTRQYARLVSEWIANVGLDSKLFGRAERTCSARLTSSDKCQTRPCWTLRHTPPAVAWPQQRQKERTRAGSSARTKVPSLWHV